MSYQHFAAGHIHSYNTHTHTLNGPFSGTIRVVSRYQKGKINLDFTEVRDSEWQWHQLGRMPFLQPNQRRQSTGGDQRTEEENTVITVSKYNTRNYTQTENNRNKINIAFNDVPNDQRNRENSSTLLCCRTSNTDGEINRSRQRPNKLGPDLLNILRQCQSYEQLTTDV